MIQIHGWSDSISDDGCELAIKFTDGVPERVSVTADDDGTLSSSLPSNLVHRHLRKLGFSAESISWEAGEADGESVGFLSGVQTND